MECLIGITGRDFVLMATDCVATMSILAMKKGARVLYSILLVMRGHGKMRNAEYRCGMAIEFGLELG